MIDLTTLEGKDTPGKVRALAGKARRPDPTDPSIPSVAALCVYPEHDPDGGRGAARAPASRSPPWRPTSRPARHRSRSSWPTCASAVEMGADEIDMVIDRGAFLAGDYASVYDEIVAVKEACGDAHLKVILETGELETYDNVRRASVLAMAAGADFIKTSTGKVEPAATLPVTLVMLEAIRDFHAQTGRVVGMKPAGGIRTAKEAIGYLTTLYETLGPAWMTPDLFRFGASSLLNDVLMQIRKERTGRYSGGDYFTLATEPMQVAPGTIAVWSDLGCPWSHAVVWRLHDARRRLGLEAASRFDHHAFPLELFNNEPTPAAAARGRVAGGRQRWRRAPAGSPGPRRTTPGR